MISMEDENTDIQEVALPPPRTRKVGIAPLRFVGGQNPLSPTYLDALNDSSVTDERPGAYDTLLKYKDIPEPSLFDLWAELAFHTDFGSVFKDALVSAILPPFHFTSKSGKHKQVEDFWKQHQMNDQLRSVVEQGIVYGAGVGQFRLKGLKSPQLLHFKRLDSTSIELERDSSGNIKVFQKQEGKDGKSSKIKLETIVDGRLPKNVFLYVPFENPRSPWGWSAFRPVIFNISGLNEMGIDIFAAVKNNAYIQRVLKMDLSDAKDLDEKDNAIGEATEYFDRFESATNTILVMENVHEFGYAGSLPGQASGGQRLTPLMPIIEPVLSVTLLRFKMALGHFEQANATAKILKEQEDAMEDAIMCNRLSLCNKIIYEIVPKILGLQYPENMKDWRLAPEHDVEIVFDHGRPTSLRDKVDIYTVAVEFGMMTPRRASELCDLDDPYANWTKNGFLKDGPQDLQAKQAGAAVAGPKPGSGTTTQKANARRTIRNESGANDDD